jgi:CheY-like chemotaxis protein
MQPKAVDSGPAALLALEQAQEAGKPFQLILVDAMMPEMDGFTLVEQIRTGPAPTPFSSLFTGCSLPHR